MASSLGLQAGTVRLVPYDPAWPDLFSAEASRLNGALSPLPIVLEHIGSTAVPGLLAKPVLDVLAGFADDTHVKPYIERIVTSGYVHRGNQGIPGREFFRRGNPRAYHVHLTAIGSAFWHEHLGFRDYLRTHGAVRDDYARLKQALAARFPDDRDAYIKGKTRFVRGIVKLATRSREA
jgi:GrpB-like predicted nucleotidyltransferase (UPF0157 family)